MEFNNIFLLSLSCIQAWALHIPESSEPGSWGGMKGDQLGGFPGYLGGGNSNIVHFHPYLGDMIQYDPYTLGYECCTYTFRDQLT